VSDWPFWKQDISLSFISAADIISHCEKWFCSSCQNNSFCGRIPSARPPAYPPAFEKHFQILAEAATAEDDEEEEVQTN
jgi:hypothetical protein